MPKNHWFFVSLMIFLLALFIYSCGSGGGSSDTPSTGLISGPDRGVGMNNGDYAFHSLAVSKTSSEVVYFGSEGNGMFKSIDGGSNWTWLRQGLIISNSSYPEIYDVAIDPNNNDVVYAGALGGYGPNSVSGPYKTTDGGDNWTRSITGLGSNYYASAIEIDPSGSNILYLAISGGTSTGGDDAGTFYDGAIYKSTNSGESWSNLGLATPIDKSRITKIMAWDSNNIYFVGTNTSNTAEAVGLMKSSDAGQNWSQVNTPDIHVEVFDVAPLDKNKMIVGTFDSLYMYKSSNGGTSWESFSFYGPYEVEISPFDSDTAFISHTDTLYKSTDWMQTMQPVLTVEASVNIAGIEFALSEANTIYVSSDHYRIFKSTDAGDTFSLVADLRSFIDSN